MFHIRVHFFVNFQVPEAGEKEGKKGEKIRSANILFLMNSHIKLQRKKNIENWKLLESNKKINIALRYHESLVTSFSVCGVAMRTKEKKVLHEYYPRCFNKHSSLCSLKFNYLDVWTIKCRFMLKYQCQLFLFRSRDMSSHQHNLLGVRDTDSVTKILNKLLAHLRGDCLEAKGKSFSKLIRAALDILRSIQPQLLEEKKDLIFCCWISS